MQFGENTDHWSEPKDLGFFVESKRNLFTPLGFHPPGWHCPSWSLMVVGFIARLGLVGHVFVLREEIRSATKWNFCLLISRGYNSADLLFFLLEQRSKPWLVRLYTGLYYPVICNIRVPINQPVEKMSQRFWSLLTCNHGKSSLNHHLGNLFSN